MRLIPSVIINKSLVIAGRFLLPRRVSRASLKTTAMSPETTASEK